MVPWANLRRQALQAVLDTATTLKIESRSVADEERNLRALRAGPAQRVTGRGVNWMDSEGEMGEKNGY